MRALIFAVLALVAAAGCGGGPCTDCPDISGLYDAIIDPTDVKRSSCKTVYFEGSRGALELQQHGSDISLSTGEVGTLYESMVLIFEPLTVESNLGRATVTIGGRIIDRDGQPSFEGTYTIVLARDKCRLTMDTRWARLEPGSG